MAIFTPPIRVNLSWSKLRDTAADRRLSIQFDDSVDPLEVFAVDGSVVFLAEIYTGAVPYNIDATENAADLEDFQANYQSQSNKSNKQRASNGAEITAPTFEDTGGVYPKWVGHLYDVTAGATNIFDELITTEQQLRGGWYEMMDTNAAIGDYIEESVIDKDDVLGYFSAYGYTVGVDVLELKKYVETEYINPLQIGNRQVFQANSTFAIVAGLYTRTVYRSVGTVDLKLKVTTLAYE